MLKRWVIRVYVSSKIVLLELFTLQACKLGIECSSVSDTFIIIPSAIPPIISRSCILRHSFFFYGIAISSPSICDIDHLHQFIILMNENSTERKRRRRIGKGSNRLTTKYYCNRHLYMAFDNISSQIFLVQITLSFEKEMSDATFALAQFWRSYLVEGLQ